MFTIWYSVRVIDVKFARMDRSLTQQRKVKPEQLIKLLQSRQVPLSMEEAEALLDLLYTLAMIFCQQNPETE